MKKRPIMGLNTKLSVLLMVGLLNVSCFAKGNTTIIEPAKKTIERVIGARVNDIHFNVIPPDNGQETFYIEACEGKLTIGGSGSVAICYAFSTYLRGTGMGMKTWSGQNLNLPAVWPDYEKTVTTPYNFRYFINVVTYGYTTPFWDWSRWEKEIDWMALHGVNMPLATVASEAVAERVWLKMGLTKEEVRDFFTSPAYLPWHRMGNLNKWGGPLSDAWQKDQVELQHKILTRMRELGMEPIVPAFAGFVPETFILKNNIQNVTHLSWGGFKEDENAYVLPPDSPFFEELGTLFIQEWENEFGPFTYYLSDNFNEMVLPLPEGDEEGKHRLLEQYGESIYRSIAAGNPDAVWVTQGWTFGARRHFWDRESLQALLSKVPDDKMIIIDLGNEYPEWVWRCEDIWKKHEGFYGKNWIFSYVPNFGGKSALTGDLNMYATKSIEALRSPYGRNLVGFGSAPEGTENNEIVYELLADMGWSDSEIDLDEWLATYCRARYGGYPDGMKKAWELLRRSVYGSLYAYPRFTWQTVVPDTRRVSLIDKSPEFMNAVKLFLSCSGQLEGSQLYVNDAIEFTSFYLAAIADNYYEEALKAETEGRTERAGYLKDQAVSILYDVDRLLASHPLYRLEEWIGYARGQGADPREAEMYEADAKRLITTWGGRQNDYAARFWSGLIRDYYIPRIQMHFSADRENIRAWEEEWINKTWEPDIKPFGDPLRQAIIMVNEAGIKHRDFLTGRESSRDVKLSSD